MRDDPFHTLGLSSSATADEVRVARRQLAKAHHPDAGGDAARMQAVNDAASAALRLLESPPAAEDVVSEPTSSTGATDVEWSGVTRDVASFTVEVLPAETFAALLVVTTWIGEVLDDDPPYRLDTHLESPDCWCRLELVPEAGASTVSITVAVDEGASPPDIEIVRDLWVANLNRFDWHTTA